MGRTVMPFSHVLETERGSWKEFRKRLSKEVLLEAGKPNRFEITI